MKASLYVGKEVTLYRGRGESTVYGLLAHVSLARHNRFTDRIEWGRTVVDDVDGSYRFADGSESEHPTPLIESPAIDHRHHRSIGGLSSSGIAVFADGSAINRTPSGTLESYPYPGDDYVVQWPMGLADRQRLRKL